MQQDTATSPTPTASTSLRLKLASRLSGVVPNLDAGSRTIVFTHVPKTGGTTLDHVFGAAAAITKHRWRRLRMKSLNTGPRSERLQRLLDFETVAPSILDDADYLTGHFQFGIHRCLKRPCLYVTLLRDPVARLLSNLRFGFDRGNWPRDASLESIIKSGRMLDNIQTRQLAGIADREVPCTAETLVLALKNLRQNYAIVGLTERFDETLKALITLLGWPDIAYSDRQVSQVPADGEMEAKARTEAERLFSYDMELYAEAASRPVPWAAGIMDGTPLGTVRQANVLLTSPRLQLNNRPVSLLPASVFDSLVRPAVLRQGGEVVFV